MNSGYDGSGSAADGVTDEDGDPALDDDAADDAAGPSGPAAGLSLPPYLGVDLEPGLREELHDLLAARNDQLGEVYRAMASHASPPTAAQLLTATSCRNSSIVANRRVVVYAVFNAVIPPGPTVALQAARRVRTLLKSATSQVVQDHLTVVEENLARQASSEDAVITETVQLKSASASLVEEMQNASGVYVFTYPHYWRHPYVTDTERRLLKVGRTGTRAWSRVLAQTKLTAMPEDPILLRVYQAEDPVATEKAFHDLLDAAEHQRSTGISVGKEWFVTTIDFCDTIGGVLGLHVHRNDEIDDLID